DLVADPDRRLQFDASRRHVNEQLRIDLGECVPQVAELRNPGAMNGVACPAQDAIDRLDGITRGAQNDERDRILLGQTAASPGERIPRNGADYSALTRLALPGRPTGRYQGF